MRFISLLQSFYKKTPSLRLRLRVASLRLSSILFGVCSVPVRRLFGLCSPFVRYLSLAFSVHFRMIYGR